MRKSRLMPFTLLTLIAATAACSQPAPLAVKAPEAPKADERATVVPAAAGVKAPFEVQQRRRWDDDDDDDDDDDWRRRRARRRSFVYIPYSYPYYAPSYYQPRYMPYANVQVVIQGYRFSPATIQVPVGGTVTWYNQDPVPHTVTHPLTGGYSTTGAFEGYLPSGGSYSYTFNTPGVFDYYCRLHPSMRGSVRVGG